MKNLTLKKNLTSIALVSCALIGALIACGPSYMLRLLDKKNTIISHPSRGSILIFPNNNKKYEHNKHLKTLPARMRATLNTDLTDLKKAAPDIKEEVLTDYKSIRTEMLVTQWNTSAKILNTKPELNWLDKPTLAALPIEFSIYLRGAVAYRTGKTEEAREHWKAILDLPEAERKQRSTWAAWMLARTSTAANKGEAMQWYNKVKQLKKAGFPDSLDVTSRDWTAHFSEKSADYITALDIYIKEGQENITDPSETFKHIGNVFSLAENHLKDDPKSWLQFLKVLASNKDRSLIYSYCLRTRYTNDKRDQGPNQAWVKALQASGRRDLDTDLGICAVTARNVHDEKTLKICLDEMQNPTIESLWLRAQLAEQQFICKSG